MSVRGYLIVLNKQEEQTTNKDYKGINCIPAHYMPEDTPYPDEITAMDIYAFEYTNQETNLIPTLDKAMELLKYFNKAKRRFKVIYCEEVKNKNDGEIIVIDNYIFLGFDVAGLDGYWSIVNDFPAHDKIMKQKYFSKLNESGLFNTFEDASVFLKDYCLRKLPDHDGSFKILKVYEIPTPPIKSV